MLDDFFLGLISLKLYSLYTSFNSLSISGTENSSLNASSRLILISSEILLFISLISSSVKSFESIRKDS